MAGARPHSRCSTSTPCRSFSLKTRWPAAVSILLRSLPSGPAMGGRPNLNGAASRLLNGSGRNPATRIGGRCPAGPKDQRHRPTEHGVDQDCIGRVGVDELAECLVLVWDRVQDDVIEVEAQTIHTAEADPSRKRSVGVGVVVIAHQGGARRVRRRSPAPRL